MSQETNVDREKEQVYVYTVFLTYTTERYVMRNHFAQGSSRNSAAGNSGTKNAVNECPFFRDNFDLCCRCVSASHGVFFWKRKKSDMHVIARHLLTGHASR